MFLREQRIETASASLFTHAANRILELSPGTFRGGNERLGSRQAGKTGLFRLVSPAFEQLCGALARIKAQILDQSTQDVGARFLDRSQGGEIL